MTRLALGIRPIDSGKYEAGRNKMEGQCLASWLVSLGLIKSNLAKRDPLRRSVMVIGWTCRYREMQRCTEPLFHFLLLRMR